MFGEGISRTGCVLDAATELDFVKKSGAWYNYGDQRLGQGRENSKKYLQENPDVLAELEQRVREVVFANPEPQEQEKENEDIN